MEQNGIELRFIVKGMDCADCARTIEKGVSGMAGVTACALNFTAERLQVEGSCSAAEVMALVQKLGYGIEPAGDTHHRSVPAMPSFWQYLWTNPATRLAAIGSVFVLPGLILTEILGQEQFWVDGLALVALILAGWPVARSAGRALRYSREININVLMTIAAVGAVAIGAYVEAALVMVLFALGEGLEGYTTDRARHSIRSLLTLAPQTATRVRPDGTLEGAVPVEQLKIDEIILVRPGERVPMDGLICQGHSEVNLAALTGESRLVPKAKGDELLAGTVNGAGVLEVCVTHLAADNTISRMIQLVEEAQERRAPAQRFVDRFARYYTPAVVLIAALTIVVPPLFFGQPFLNPAAGGFGWLYRGLAVLVVACPCALVISTPVTVVSALSRAARNGVLVKGGVFLERLQGIQALAFDKTGTLTAGKPAVVNVRSLACELPQSGQTLVWPDCPACADVLALAGAVEAGSEHPVAHAVRAAVAGAGLTGRYSRAEAVNALIGGGIRGQVAGQEILVGSHAYFEGKIDHPAGQCASARVDAQLGYTPLLVGRDNSYLGTITVADTVREQSRAVVATLRQLRLKALVMLTGDEPAVAREIGRQVGLTDIRAGLLPAEKLAVVEQLRADFGPVAMVGDGINDAPALAAADVGIAVGGAGASTQAMETADVTLMRADLSQLPFLLGLSRSMMATIKVNVLLSLGIKLAFLLLVLWGRGTMWMAVIADVGTSLLVTANGMRLLRWREKSASG